LSKIVKDCQRLSKIAKDCQRLPKIVKDCQRLSKIAKDCQRLPKIAKDCQRSEICDGRKPSFVNNLQQSSTIFHLQFGFGSIYNLRSLAIWHFVGLYVSYMSKIETE